MDHAIPFAEGSYIVDQAFLVTPDNNAVYLYDAFIDVFSDPRGRRLMQGQAFVRNTSVVQLLEKEDRMDLLLNLGVGFKYLLKHPTIQAGKVFDPSVHSILRFAPTTAIIELSEQEYASRCDKLTILRD